MATPTSNSTEISFFNEPASSLVAALVDDAKWGGTVGTGVTLSYSFPSAAPSFAPDYSDLNEWGQNDDSINYFPLNANQQQAFKAALDSWANVANITFVEFDDNAGSVGEIRVAFSSVVNKEEASGYAYSLDNFPAAGDIWLNPYVFTPSTSLATNTFEFNTLIHEIGHAINLKHPFDPGFSWDTILPTALDHLFNTVMSYTEDPTANDYYASRYSSTPMVLDIDAIQYVYGANASYNTGDDIYTFDSNGEYLQTLWDAGGTDTIVYTGSAAGNIDLRGGKASSLGKPVDLLDPFTGAVVDQVDTTVWIANNVAIENATGNSGDNKIIGNDLDNILRGNAGNDILKGGAGDDTLAGDRNNDRLVGGSGDDNLSGDNGVDKLNGGSGNDLLAGGNGNDDLNGKAGDDVLNGEAGNDILKGHIGRDTLDGGEGSDTYIVVVEEQDADIYTDSGTGSGDIDRLDGSRVDELVLGTIFSAAGTGLEVILGDNTRLLGANEALHWDFSSLILNGIRELKGSTDNDVVLGADGDDKIKGIDGADSLSGGAGNDKLIGGAGNDNLHGDAGEDRLIGGGGDDVLNGDSGNDILKGGSGTDTFVFDTNLAAVNIDTIIGFNSIDDVIALDDAIFTTLTTPAAAALAPAEFKASAAGMADDADDRIIYNLTTGDLFYDADGAGGEDAINFARLVGAPSLEADDFIVIA